MDNEQKITTDITVPNKNMEVLKKHFGGCFDKNGNFDIEKFKQELSENEIDFYKESYGLDWLGKSYARILASDEATTLLKEDEEHNQKDENKDSENLLIKGDNLEVLKHLSNAYYEKIKMIYIDPPYNTGSDGFVYQDDRKFTVSELRQLAGVDEEKAKRILDFTRSKSNSHSAWLTFMYPRLYIAKQLLREDGVIFISIDENEVAQLRLLMDEVFGEENFISEIVWQKKTGPADASNIATITESILVYTKNINIVDCNKNEEAHDENRYKETDEYLKERGPFYFDNLDRGTLGYHKTLDYPIYSNDGEFTYPNGRKEQLNDGWRWKWSEKKVKWGLENGFIDVQKSTSKNSGYGVYYKIYLKVDNDGNPINRSSPYKNIIQGVLNTHASNEIKALFGNSGVFSNPKPSTLIKKLLMIGSKSNDIVLDFFAGSGTTGDAVMQLNAEDGGNRKYILVQLPEPIDKKKSKTAYDFVKDELGISEPTIFEITKERLIRASKKIKEETIVSKIVDKEKEITELNGQLDLDNKEEKIQLLKTEVENLKNQDLGFRIFETTPIWDDYDLEADELHPQLEIFDESTLSAEDMKALLITWKTYDGIALTEKLNEIDFGGYTGYFADEKLYLMDKGFLTDNLKNLLEKIDTDKKFNPRSVVAFGYNFDSKNLREISENIKSYANKKNIDIDFITRY